jgi:hypothetical protein
MEDGLIFATCLQESSLLLLWIGWWDLLRRSCNFSSFVTFSFFLLLLLVSCKAPFVDICINKLWAQPEMLQAKAFHFIFILKSYLLDANLELTKHIAADNAFLYSQNSIVLNSWCIFRWYGSLLARLVDVLFLFCVCSCWYYEYFVF